MRCSVLACSCGAAPDPVAPALVREVHVISLALQRTPILLVFRYFLCIKEKDRRRQAHEYSLSSVYTGVRGEGSGRGGGDGECGGGEGSRGSDGSGDGGGELGGGGEASGGEGSLPLGKVEILLCAQRQTASRELERRSRSSAAPRGPTRPPRSRCRRPAAAPAPRAPPPPPRTAAPPSSRESACVDICCRTLLPLTH